MYMLRGRAGPGAPGGGTPRVPPLPWSVDLSIMDPPLGRSITRGIERTPPPLGRVVRNRDRTPPPLGRSFELAVHMNWMGSFQNDFYITLLFSVRPFLAGERMPLPKWGSPRSRRPLPTPARRASSVRRAGFAITPYHMGRQKLFLDRMSD